MGGKERGKISTFSVTFTVKIFIRTGSVVRLFASLNGCHIKSSTTKEERKKKQQQEANDFVSQWKAESSALNFGIATHINMDNSRCSLRLCKTFFKFFHSFSIITQTRTIRDHTQQWSKMWVLAIVSNWLVRMQNRFRCFSISLNKQ